MKTLFIFTFSLLILNVGIGQTFTKEQIILDSDKYNELKIRGELNSDYYTIINPNEEPPVHPTVYSSNSQERTNDCNCWIEPDDTYTATSFAANGTDDGSTPLISIPFDFDFFGDSYDGFWINANGTITFDGPDGTFSPSGFPNNDLMLSPFWADADFGCMDCGTVLYKVTDDAVYVNWLQVGYFNDNSDKVNTFQVIFTDSNSSPLGGDINVQFCYQDMQWTAGDASAGTEGLGGAPAMVGASAGNNIDFILFGEFSQEGVDYDGPFGDDDGVSWLDNQSITFNADISPNLNLAPIVLGTATECDTIFLCANDVENLSYIFLSPEEGQTISLTIDDGGFPEIGLETTQGIITSAAITLEAGLEAAEYEIVLTATDDGTPPESTSISLFVQVSDIVVPELTITSEGVIVDTLTYCQGLEGVPLQASSGFDNLIWSNNYLFEAGTFSQGVYSVTGFIGQCDTEAAPVAVFETQAFNLDWSASELLICDADSSVITFEDANIYPNYEWDIPNSNGEILFQDDENNSITVSSGLYNISAEDENGCLGESNILINSDLYNLSESNFPQPICGINTNSWAGSWADPNECTMVMFLSDSEGDSWEGAYLEAYIDGEGPFSYSISDDFPFVGAGLDLFHGQTVEFFWNPGIDDEDIRVQLFEPGNNILELFDTDNGDLLTSGDEPFFTVTADCGFSEHTGSWTITPETATLSHPNVHTPLNMSQTLTVPEGFEGTVNLLFESDYCGVSQEFEVEFGIADIDDLVVSDIECETDSTYSLLVNAEGFSEITDLVEISINGEFLGAFNSANLPLSFSGINLGIAEEEVVTVCTDGFFSCCKELSYPAPNCSTDNIPEIEKQFLIYPNPVSETLFIKSDVHLSASRIVIYDSTGREVLVQSGMADQISVAELASGVYQVVVFEGGERVFVTEIIKE